MGAQNAVRSPAVLLKPGLRRIERRKLLRALVLIVPLFAFLLLNFALPIAAVLMRSINDVELASAMPRTAAAIQQWDGRDLPDAGIAAILVEDLIRARDQGTVSSVANRLNYDVNGFRTLLLSTARRVPLSDAGSALDQLIKIDARWADRNYWAAIKHAAGPYTSFYLLAAVDRRVSADGDIVLTPVDQRVFINIFFRTFWISLVVTTFCLILGYPVAYLLANVHPRVSNLLMILVLLPFWTSVLVRTTGWAVLLQREGTVNTMLRAMGAISEPMQLIYNRTGVYVAMTQVLLPFMILPLYGVMKGIAPTTMRAALSLARARGWLFVACISRKACPGSAPAACSCSSLRSVPHHAGWWVAPTIRW
jgi:putative spermidine/putrescine transport system permease protein